MLSDNGELEPLFPEGTTPKPSSDDSDGGDENSGDTQMSQTIGAMRGSRPIEMSPRTFSHVASERFNFGSVPAANPVLKCSKISSKLRYNLTTRRISLVVVYPFLYVYELSFATGTTGFRLFETVFGG